MNWFHSCKRAAELLSQRMDEPLKSMDALRLRVHLSMCGDCRQVEEQLERIEALSKQLFSGDADAGGT